MSGSILGTPSCSYGSPEHYLLEFEKISYSPSAIDIAPLPPLPGDTGCPAFIPKQTHGHLFFSKCFELGLIDSEGTWISDTGRFPLPAVDISVVQRIESRLQKKITRVTKNLKGLTKHKTDLIIRTIEEVSRYCKQVGKKNPFFLNSSKTLASINIDISLKILLIQLIKKAGRAIKSLEIVGGDLPAILGSKYYKECIRKTGKEELLNFDLEHLLKNIDIQAQDLDLRINVPHVSYDEMEHLVDCLIIAIAESFTFEVEIFDKIVFLVRELAFNKYSHIYEIQKDQTNHFFTLSFDDADGTGIDFCFAANMLHKQLFLRHGLALNIMTLLMPRHHSGQRLIPYSDVALGWQAIFDRIVGIVSATNLHIPFYNGWVRLVSSLVKGNCCPHVELEKTLRKQILSRQPIELVESLQKIIIDHNRSDFNALIASVFITSTLLHYDVSCDFINNLWMSLKEHSCNTALFISPGSQLITIAEMIGNRELTFIEVSDILHTAALVHLSLPSFEKERYRLENISGKPHLSVTFGNDVNVLMKFDPDNAVSNFVNLLKSDKNDPALRLLSLLTRSYEGLHIYPSVAGIYRDLFLPLKVSISHLESINAHLNNYEISLIALTFKMISTSTYLESLTEIFETLLPLIVEGSDVTLKIRLIEGIREHFSEFLRETSFDLLKTYIYQRGKSLSGAYKLILQDLSGCGIPLLVGLTYNLWKRSKIEPAYYLDSGRHIVKPVINHNTLSGLKIIEELISLPPAFDPVELDMLVDIMNNIPVSERRLEYAYAMDKILNQIFLKLRHIKKGSIFDEKKLRELTTSVIYELCNYNKWEKSHKLLINAIKVAVFDHHLLNAAQVWIEIFRNLLFNSKLDLVEIIACLEQAKRAEFVTYLDQDASYHRMLLILTERCFEEGMKEIFPVYLSEINAKLLDAVENEKLLRLIDTVIQRKIIEGDIKDVADIKRKTPKAISRIQLEKYRIQLIHQYIRNDEIDKAKNTCLLMLKNSRMTNRNIVDELKPLLIQLFKNPNFSNTVEMLSVKNIEVFFSPKECKDIIIQLFLSSECYFDQTPDVRRQQLLNPALKYIEEDDVEYLITVFPHIDKYVRSLLPITSDTEKNDRYSKPVLKDKVPLMIKIFHERKMFTEIIGLIQSISYYSDQYHNDVYFHTLNAVKETFDFTEDSPTSVHQTYSLLNFCIRSKKASQLISEEYSRDFLFPFIQLLIEKGNYEMAYSLIFHVRGNVELLREVSNQLLFYFAEHYKESYAGYILSLLNKYPNNRAGIWKNLLEIGLVNHPPTLQEKLSSLLYQGIITNRVTGDLSEIAECLIILLKPGCYCPGSKIIELVDYVINLDFGPLNGHLRVLLLERSIQSLNNMNIVDPHVEKILHFRETVEPGLLQGYLTQNDILLLKLCSKTRSPRVFHRTSVYMDALFNVAEPTAFPDGFHETLVEFLFNFTRFKNFDSKQEQEITGCILRMLNRFNGSEQPLPLTPELQSILWQRILTFRLNAALSDAADDDIFQVMKLALNTLKYVKKDFEQIKDIFRSILYLSVLINDMSASCMVQYKDIFRNMITEIFSGVFEGVPDVAISAVLLSPRNKVYYQNIDTGTEIMLSGHLKNPLIEKASAFYVSHLIHFCNLLIDFNHTKNENVIQTIKFVSESTKNLILTCPEKHKEITLLVKKYCFYSTKIDDEIIFDYALRQGNKLYRYAVSKDIFDGYKLRLLYCIYYTELHEWVGSGIPDEKRLEILDYIMHDIVMYGSVPALRHGFNILKSLSKLTFCKYPLHFRILFSRLIEAFNNNTGAHISSLHLVDESSILFSKIAQNVKIREIEEIVGSSPYLDEMTVKFRSIGVQLKQIPLYKSIGLILKPNRYVLFSDESKHRGTVYSLALASLFFDSLIAGCDKDVRIIRFLCKYIGNIAKANGYHTDISLFQEHTRKIRLSLARYVGNPDFPDRETIFKCYEKLLFIKNPAIENVHPWILMLLSSELHEDYMLGRAVLEKALRSCVYLKHPELLKCLPLARRLTQSSVDIRIEK